MTIFYLSGPISSPDPSVMSANKEAFMTASERIRAAMPGGIVNPVQLCRETEELWSDSPEDMWIACMRICLRELTHCDAIVMLPGYEASRGAAEELRTARMLGMRVHLLHELLDRHENAW